MPRYYIDTFNSTVVHDDEGVDLPSRDAVRREVHKALASMMRDETDGRSSVQFRADIRDDSGNRIMTATLLLVIDETG